MLAPDGFCQSMGYSTIAMHDRAKSLYRYLSCASRLGFTWLFGESMFVFNFWRDLGFLATDCIFLQGMKQKD